MNDLWNLIGAEGATLLSEKTMNMFWEALRPEGAAFLVNVVLQSAVIFAVTLAAERVVRKHATARQAVLLCGLVAGLATFAVVAVQHQLGVQETQASEATGKINADESGKAVRQGRSLFLGQKDGRIIEAPAASVSPLEFNAGGTPVVRHLEYEVDGATTVFVGPGQNVKVQAEYQNLPAAEQQPRATDAAVREAIFEMIAHPKR